MRGGGAECRSEEISEGGGGLESVVVVLGESVGAREHEGAVLGLLGVLITVVVRGVEVDVGAPLHGCEECRRHTHRSCRSGVAVGIHGEVIRGRGSSSWR